LKISIPHLRETMNKLKPGLSQRGIVEGLNNFMFTGETLSSYNDRISISFPFSTDFQCSVNSDEIYQVVSRLTSPEGELWFDNDQLLLTTEGTKLGVAANKDEKMLEILQTINSRDITDWKPCPRDLTKGLSLCSFSASRDMTQRFLSTICIKNSYILSSDNLRISRFIMENSIENQILLPISSSEKLENYDIVEFSVREGWAHFKVLEGGIFSTRTIFEDYPDVDCFFEGKGEKITLPKGLLRVLDSVTIFAEGIFDIDKTIELIFTKGKLICKSSKETGWIETEIFLPYKGKEVMIIINPVFLKQILEKTTEISIFENKVLFKAENFSHVMALCL